jgi:hypothetical protein
LLAAAALKTVAAMTFVTLARPASAQGNGNGNGKGGKSDGASASAHAASRSAAAPASPASRLSVTHRNGMSESVSGGRYEMHDARGRLIVRRQATTGDVSRLRSAR